MTTSASLSRLVVISVLISTLFLTACDDATAIDNQTKEQVVSIPVEAVTAQTGNISSSYTTTAILEAKEEAFVVARASGIIEHIYVEEGDYVEKGQKLAQLDKKRYELNLIKAQADLTGIEKELAKINQVYAQQLVSSDTFDKITAQYEAASAVLALAELDLKETTIIAPISGYIAERNAKVGNLTESFQRERMFHIVQQNVLQGIVYLPESQLRNIHSGQQASLTITALGDQQVTGYVARISPVIDATTGTFKVTLTVPNDKAQLKAGMFSEVALQYGLHTQTILLPRKAIIAIDDKSSVFIVDHGIARKVDVETGFENGNTIEIIKGLQGTEQVVIVGHQNLKDASPVDIVNG
jgi:RND family efflux transporter MFP subunit